MWRRGVPVRPGDPPPPGAPVRDKGLLWLGLAVTMWGLQGLGLLLPLAPSAGTLAWRLLSSANNACLLIAASHLDYGVEFLQRVRAWRHWDKAAIGGSVGVALVTLALGALLGPTSRMAQAPDIVLSAATLALFGFGLSRSFYKRGFAPMAALAVVAIGLLTIAQLPPTDLEALGMHGDRGWALNQVAKTLTVTVFLTLGMSWVHEVARRPSKGTVQLYFTGQTRLGGHRRRYIVRIGETQVEMRETPHRDLLVLALRRLAEKEREDGGWMPLPDLVGRLDESRIRRMREDLRPVGLDVAIESNFQKAYRLALAPDRIGFDRRALDEDTELGPLLKQVT